MSVSLNSISSYTQATFFFFAYILKYFYGICIRGNVKSNIEKKCFIKPF